MVRMAGLIVRKDIDLVRERKTDATLGVLADSLRSAGTCVEASGGAGASIAAARAAASAASSSYAARASGR